MKGFVISFVAIICCLIARNVCFAWTFSVTPIRVIDYEPLSPSFIGDGSEYFKVLNIDDKSMLVGAMNNVYNLSLTRLMEDRDKRIEWHSQQAHVDMCRLKGKNDTDCQNYIRMFVRLNDGQFMLCGTNSFKPTCRYYKSNPIKGDSEMLQEFEGEAICPYSPTQNSTFFYTDSKELYSATSVGFAGSQQLIYRQKLSTNQISGGTYSTAASQQTLRTDDRNDILNQASFVNSLEYNGYILFFFREQAIEYQNCGKSMYSRVARVCKNDKGGSHPFHNRFSSFLKTRLNCSMPGEFPFYFDELQGTSRVVEGIYGNDRDDLMYSVMTTNDNAIDGSAICVFSMRTILEAFEGRFNTQRDINSVWKPLDDADLPEPRPGQCVDDSRTIPSKTVNFVLKHPLMHGAVNPIHDSPLLVHTGSNYKFTSIAVDPQVESLNGKTYDVLFVGTDNGHVLKVINVGDSIDDNKPIVISEQQVLPHGQRVKELRISRSSQRLIVISDSMIRSIPLYNTTGLSQCARCIGSRDPYVVWDSINRECIFFNKTNLPKNTASYSQSIDGKSDEVCGGEVISPKSSINSPSVQHGTVTSIAKNPLPSENETNEQEEELMKHHKYYNIGVVQAPQNAGEYLEGEIQKSDTTIIVFMVLAALIIGVVGGFTIAKCKPGRDSSRNPFQLGITADNCRNQLGWPSNPSKHLMQLPTMNNGGKDINLLMNTTNASTIKKDNLELEFSLGGKDRTHECKNSNESLDKEPIKSAVLSPVPGGTLQKVKKTYI